MEYVQVKKLKHFFCSFLFFIVKPKLFFFFCSDWLYILMYLSQCCLYIQLFFVFIYVSRSI